MPVGSKNGFQRGTPAIVCWLPCLSIAVGYRAFARALFSPAGNLLKLPPLRPSRTDVRTINPRERT